jgi:hypothetical protein
MSEDEKKSFGSRRTNHWSRNSFLISLMIHGGFIAIAVSFVAIHTYNKPKPEVTGELKKPTLERRKLEMKVKPQDLNKSSARPAMKPRLVAMAPSKVPMPAIAKPPRDPTLKLSKDSAFSRGMGRGMWGTIGSGFGQGGPGISVPPSLKGRCTPQDRLRLLREKGAGPEVDQTIEKALRWFKSEQNRDGSWGEQHHVTAMTGLGLLAFMGRCETDKSREYGQTVSKAIDFLVAVGNGNDGKLWDVKLAKDGNMTFAENPSQNSPYEHAIATLALAEAFTITKRPDIKPVLEKAVRIIVDGQIKENGGWQYSYQTAGDLDMSVVGWQMQALKAAVVADVRVAGLDECLRRAVDMVRDIQCEDGSFPYRSNGKSKQKVATGQSGLAGAGLLCMQLSGMKPSRSLLRTSIDHILENHVVDYASPKANLYAWYYNTYGIFMAQDRWNTWNDMFLDQIVNNQSQDGSWPPTGTRIHAYAGTGNDKSWMVYRTALCTLMLEVYFRYLPSAS